VKKNQRSKISCQGPFKKHELTLILTAWEFKVPFVKMKISPGFKKKSKIPCKKSKQAFLFQRFSLKCHFQCAFDNNLSVTHVFIKQIFRAVEVAPPFPLPPQALQRGGVVVALFSNKPWLWLWL
jgi:hypothetical protein